jgi:hypothetical protein
LTALALLERETDVPSTPPPEPIEPFYSPGRIAHALTHWHCCTAARRTPGACSNDPYVGEGKRASRHDAKTDEGSAMFSDLYGAWSRLNGLRSQVLLSFVEIGPMERLERTTWYDRRLEWWIMNRMRFANLPAETLLKLADESTAHMSYDLTHWRKR